MRSVFLISVILIVGCVAAGTGLHAQTDGSGDQAVDRSAKRAQQRQTWQLRYLMEPGEIIRWQVEQIASTDASIAGFSEKTSLRTRSVIAWKVLGVDARGNMTVQDQLESAVEWQKIGDGQPVSYDSTQDEEVPEIYQAIAEKIGKPIATTTISPFGEVVQKENHIRTAEFGMGAFTPPLPEQPVAVGARWNTPEDLQARRADGTLKVVKTRMLYTLRKVEGGLATISFRREVLTPVEDPKVKSQLQQKLNQGALLFDIARGRVTRKVVQWDEKVQGFEGDDSFLHYIGKYTMELVEDPQATAENGKTGPLTPLPGESGERSSARIRPRKGKPLIRK
jgi:hypothetical protein